jgi:hypothetical protein
VPPDEKPTATDRRDALLDQLTAYHENMVRAARDGDTDTLNALVESRHDVIKRLTRVVKSAPIPQEVGDHLAKREEELQRILKLELSGIQTDIGRKARQGSAALRYRRSN